MIRNLVNLILQCYSIFIFSISSANCQSLLSNKDVSTLFPKIEANLELQFPRDHGSHDEYRIEWWYLTANLKDENQADIGAQWTLFRAALEPKNNQQKWNNSQIWMGHAALTNKDSHEYHEKFARSGVLQAGVKTEPFEAWIDDWYLRGKDWGYLTMSAKGENFEYSLELRAKGPIVKHGDNGRSVKSYSGQASAYYSQPFFDAKGWVKKDGQKLYVTGSAWADHEWSSQFISDTQEGWDWFSLNFKSGEKLMIFQVRDKVKENFYSGTHMEPNGSYKAVKPSQIQIIPIKSESTSDYVTNWSVKVKDLNIDLKIQAVNPSSKMNTLYPYWEGPISFNGSHSGTGYLEMTGYVTENNY